MLASAKKYQAKQSMQAIVATGVLICLNVGIIFAVYAPVKR